MSQAENAAIDVAAAGDVIAEKLDAMIEPVKVEPEKEEPSDIASEETPETSQPDEAESEDEISEDSNESEEQEPETEEPEEESPETFESVADLAEATGMELKDFLDSVKQKVKINGEEMEVSLSDLTAGYQMESDYRRKTTELSEQRKTFEQEKEQTINEVQSKFQEAEAITATLESQLMEEFNAINWNQLEMEDREEWLVQRQKFGEKHQQMQTVKSQIQSELQQRNEQLQAQQQEAYQTHLIHENEKLLDAIPEWSDNDIRGAEVQQMTDFLKGYGFNEAESNQIYDHRIMRLIRDAYKQQSKNQAVDVVKKKVKTLPKIVKPSGKQDKRDVKKRQEQNTWNQYQKSGSMDDLAAHIANKIK